MTRIPSHSRSRFLRTAILIARICAVSGVALAQNPPPAPAPAPTPAVPGAPAAGGASTNSPATDDIQLSFQGANIDMIVQWLSTTTGKTVLKHPQAQCQLTIVGGKKVSPREAISLVYRALSMEGFNAIESSNSILIVPDGREPKMNPELVDASRSDIPVGRQRLVKIFQLKSANATDVRDKIKPLLNDKAALDINERSNQLIITDYNDGLSLAGDLIKALDTDQPGDRSVRVVSLHHVNAQDLVKELGPLYQKMSSKGGDAVEISSNDRSNSLIVLSSESNFHAIERVVKSLDTDDAQEKVMEAFPIRNADAEDVAKQLKELLNASDNSNRGGYYYYMSEMSGNSKASKKPTVVADRRRNTVVVQAPPAELSGIKKMIDALDEPVSGESLAPKIYSLKFVSAVDVEDVLNELFLKKTAQQRPYYFYDEEPQQVADKNVGRLYGKVRITSEPYSNTIIITANSVESLAAVEDVLKRLDVPSQAGESTLRVVLKHAKAATVANSLNVLFAKPGSPLLRPGNPNPQQNPNPQANAQNPNGTAPTDKSFQLEQENEEEGYFPWLGGTPENGRSNDGRNVTRQVSDLVGRVRAVADNRSNALLISANLHLFPQIIKLLDEMDGPTPQILIEARIVEVSSNFLDKLGVRWTPDGTILTADDKDNGIVAGTTTKYTKGFGGSTIANSGGGSVAAAIGALRSGVIDSTISVDFLIQFLRKNVDATVLAQPQINVRDNETAKLFVGSQVPFLRDSLNSQVGSLSKSFTYKDVGVILEVVPHVNKDGDVSLKVRTESSTLDPSQTIDGNAIVNTRNFKTYVTAHSGQTLVIGGIIQKQVSDTVRKVPVLGSIPGLGWAFKKKDKATQEVELLVFLKTTVVRDAAEEKAMTDGIHKTTPLINAFEDKMDGDAKGAAKKPKKQ